MDTESTAVSWLYSGHGSQPWILFHPSFFQCLITWNFTSPESFSATDFPRPYLPKKPNGEFAYFYKVSLFSTFPGQFLFLQLQSGSSCSPSQARSSPQGSSPPLLLQLTLYPRNLIPVEAFASSRQNFLIPESVLIVIWLLALYSWQMQVSFLTACLFRGVSLASVSDRYWKYFDEHY